MLPDSTTYGFIILLMIIFTSLGMMIGSFCGKTKGYEMGFKSGRAVERARNGVR